MNGLGNLSPQAKEAGEQQEAMIVKHDNYLRCKAKMSKYLIIALVSFVVVLSIILIVAVN